MGVYKIIIIIIRTLHGHLEIQNFFFVFPYLKRDFISLSDHVISSMCEHSKLCWGRNLSLKHAGALITS